MRTTALGHVVINLADCLCFFFDRCGLSRELCTESWKCCIKIARGGEGLNRDPDSLTNNHAALVYVQKIDVTVMFM